MWLSMIILGADGKYSRNELLENPPNGGHIDTSPFPQGLATRNLTLSIRSREKVAICGRSGRYVAGGRFYLVDLANTFI